MLFGSDNRGLDGAAQSLRASVHFHCGAVLWQVRDLVCVDDCKLQGKAWQP